MRRINAVNRTIEIAGDRHGAALYLVVAFTSIASLLLLMMFSILSANALAGQNALRRYQEVLYAESVAEQLRASLREVPPSEAAVEQTLVLFEPVSVAEERTVLFVPGETEMDGGSLRVKDCVVTVFDGERQTAEMRFSLRIVFTEGALPATPTEATSADASFAELTPTDATPTDATPVGATPTDAAEWADRVEKIILYGRTYTQS